MRGETNLTPVGQPETPKDEWLDKANSAYDSSVSYANTNWRKQWENNLKMVQSRHISGSKYTTEAYKYRSKLFRPKTRTAIRNTEAAAAAAFFSSMDVVNIQPVGDSDDQKAGAVFHKELLSHRLAEREMHWFCTVIGGLQDAQKMGAVCSYNHWDEGRPKVELTPIDQVLFHPGASWIDPINTSPYVIRMIAMYIQDVKGYEGWADCTQDDFNKALIDYNGLASTRNANQENPQQAKVEKIDDFSMVWVHEVIIRDKGKDKIFYTLHRAKKLTEPKPIEEIYWTGLRPITLGFYILETHRAMPPGVPELGEQLQREGNEIVNTRQDNVKLVLNKRYLVKRGSQVDLKSLLRNAAGSVTMVNNIDGDVKELEWNDITRSAFEEQNRVDVDFDDLVGGFNAGSIKNNRSLNETVGGMAMLQSSAGQVTDYGLKTFAETWLEPTLYQIAKLEQMYESDETAILIAAEKAELTMGIKDIMNKLMAQDLLLTVDIGVGSSNPGFRLERFISGISTFTEMVKSAPPGMDITEIGKELFGYLGYKDGSRFFSAEEDPQIQELMQKVQELEQQLESKLMESKTKVAVQQAKDQAQMGRQIDQNQADITLEVLKQHGADQEVSEPQTVKKAASGTK